MSEKKFPHLEQGQGREQSYNEDVSYIACEENESEPVKIKLEHLGTWEDLRIIASDVFTSDTKSLVRDF